MFMYMFFYLINTKIDSVTFFFFKPTITYIFLFFGSTSSLVGY